MYLLDLLDLLDAAIRGSASGGAPGMGDRHSRCASAWALEDHEPVTT